MRYRVRQFGHSTQWRMRDILEKPQVTATVFSYYDAAKVVGDNTHLTQIRHNHYDPRK
jgi:ABC-type Zn uptake system ZnuABC Zn-binding protein ZnuA